MARTLAEYLRSKRTQQSIAPTAPAPTAPVSSYQPDLGSRSGDDIDALDSRILYQLAACIMAIAGVLFLGALILFRSLNR